MGYAPSRISKKTKIGQMGQCIEPHFKKQISGKNEHQTVWCSFGIF
jgi:hypothetical protein